MRAIPSCTAMTVPTLAVEVSLAPKPAMFLSMMALISSAQDAIAFPPENEHVMKISSRDVIYHVRATDRCDFPGTNAIWKRIAPHARHKQQVGRDKSRPYVGLFC